MFNRSPLEFFRWVDRMAGQHGVPVLAIRSRPAEDTALSGNQREPSNNTPNIDGGHLPLNLGTSGTSPAV